MKNKLFQEFKDVDYGTMWHEYKKYSAVSVYDTQSRESFDVLCDNLDKIKQEALEVTLDTTDSVIMKKANKLGFYPIYLWYRYFVKEEDKAKDIDSHIVVIKHRKQVKKQLTDQVHELAGREPDMFDKNGEDKGWYKSGKNCIAYVQDKEIISILTWQFEPQNNNIHIYLTYTLPEYRSQGYGQKLIDYVKQYASIHGVKTISVCTDTTKANRVPKMFERNEFCYFKTGFVKLLKQK